MDESVELSWERFLNPEALRSNLIIASIFIASFEILKDSIIRHIRHFFTNGFDGNDRTIGEEYTSEVLSLDKSPVYASLKWLRGMGAIDDDDIEAFDEIRKCRNELAHEMLDFISKGPKTDLLPRFSKIHELTHKIGKWWIVNVEISTDPDLCDKEIDEEGIIPGESLTLRLLADIALGSEEESRLYYNEFMKHKQDRG